MGVFPVPTGGCTHIIRHVIVFRGREFSGDVTTVAVPRVICTPKSVGVNVDVNPFEPHILASNLAHAIGHNLGFGHDDSESLGIFFKY